jgi:hypothetical protein
MYILGFRRIRITLEWLVSQTSLTHSILLGIKTIRSHIGGIIADGGRTTGWNGHYANQHELWVYLL